MLLACLVVPYIHACRAGKLTRLRTMQNECAEKCVSVVMVPSSVGGDASREFLAVRWIPSPQREVQLYNASRKWVLIILDFWRGPSTLPHWITPEACWRRFLSPQRRHYPQKYFELASLPTPRAWGRDVGVRNSAASLSCNPWLAQ